MIGRLIGSVSVDSDGTAIVDVHGVGYEVIVPLGTLGRAHTDDAGRATLWIHTHVREDVLSLFGFATESDRLAFRTLLGVSSVGPKMAIGVLSALPAPELGRAIARKDIGKLTAISGIGKKTAERLLLELKDKVPNLESASDARSAASNASDTSRAVGASASADIPGVTNRDLVLRALVNMGYRPSEAERAVEPMTDRLETTPLATLVKEALAALSK